MADCASIEVDAPPQACFDAIADTERLTEWQGALKAARVLRTHPDGSADVEFTVDAKVREVTYRLRQVPEPPHRLGSRYLGGDFRDMSGEWRFLELPGGRTRVELDLTIDPGRFVPGPVKGMIREAVMRRSLKDLKARVERP